MKGLLALLLGGLGLRALLKRRRGTDAEGPETTPADELRAKLAETRAGTAAPSVEPESEAEAVPEAVPEESDAAVRRRGVHDQARAALDELA
jgi:hypothetical protein